MRAALSTLTALIFLSTSSIASAGETLTPLQRVEKGVSGAVTAVAGFSLHGTVLKAGAPWAVDGLTGLGLSTVAATLTVASVGSTVTGLGVYQVVRALVGRNPTSPWRQGLPGFVSGGLLTAIGVEGIVQIAVTGVAGLGLALGATSIIAAVGLGFLAYGAYQAHLAKARLETSAAGVASGGNNVFRTAPSGSTSGSGSGPAAPGPSGGGVTR